MTTAWVGVASREHVAAAVEGGFCQLNHGREAPLKRMQPGDRVVYYAPRDRMRAGAVVQAFVALGTILPGEPYRTEAAEGFRPYRRAVRYHRAREAPIRPLLATLSFTRSHDHWGQAFRRGAFELEPGDLHVIAEAMHAILR